MVSSAAQEAIVATVVLGLDKDSRQIVSLHCKRTYAFDRSGKCTLADHQVPFFEPVVPPTAPWEMELDVWPSKRATDLIVHACAYGGESGRAVASISVAGRTVSYAISGERKVLYRGSGSVAFSRPAPFDTMAITYENAYGGIDRSAPVSDREMLREVFGCEGLAYPRNTVGKGYAVVDSREALDGMELPNIEDPGQMLTPSSLILRDPLLWWKQPLAWSCDWFDRRWYPRCSYWGALPAGIPEDDRALREVELGWVEKHQRARLERRGIDDIVDNRVFDAASPALVLPFLHGGESIALSGMTPEGSLVLELPGARPRMRVAFAGTTHDIEPVPNRILIDVEQHRLSIVWHGVWRTERPLPQRFPGPTDTIAMELEEVDAWVDDVRVGRDGAA